MEQKNNRKNIRVFDNANTIAGVPKIILLLSSVLPLLMMMQGIIILGAMILFANTWVLVRIYKDAVTCHHFSLQFFDKDLVYFRIVRGIDIQWLNGP